jgi:hypothetical protein
MKKMMCLLVVILAMPAVSCSRQESRETISNWLRSRTGPAHVNVAGAWKDREWGSTYLRQCGSTVTGKLGSYSVYGRINGRILSMSLWSNGSQHYTATLALEQNDVLIGKYYRTTRQVYSWPMMLKRSR